MWNFIKSLLSNRFGIVMAMLNVCYFLYVTQNDILVKKLATGIALCLNAPALILAKIFFEIWRGIFSSDTYFSGGEVFLFVSLFIFIQWLFIGWLAKIIAQKITQSNL